MCDQHKQNKDFLKEILHGNVKTHVHVCYIIVEPLFETIFCQLLINLTKFWIYFISTERSLTEFVLTITSRLLGLHSLTAVSVAMRAKSCLSAVAFDVALI